MNFEVRDGSKYRDGKAALSSEGEPCAETGALVMKPFVESALWIGTGLKVSIERLTSCRVYFPNFLTDLLSNILTVACDSFSTS